MPDSIQQAAAGHLVDTDTKLTPEVIAQLSAQGYLGVARYVPLPGLKADGDIDAAELRAILDEGLAALLVQHVRLPGWDPGRQSGKTDALAAIESATAAQYLAGGDLEGIKGAARATKVFAEGWAATVVDAGYCAGCYVGYQVPLNAVQLYNLHDFHCYWSDAGPRRVATRGFAMNQKQPEVVIGGVKFDRNTVQPDRLGDMPLWMIAQPTGGDDLVG